MALRWSAHGTETEIDLQAVVDGEAESGLPHGEALSAFAAALVRRSPDLAAARAELEAAVGPDGLIEAAGTAANFQRMTRIADATGIPLDRDGGEQGAAFRAGLGISVFAGAANTPATKAAQP